LLEVIKETTAVEFVEVLTEVKTHLRCLTHTALTTTTTRSGADHAGHFSRTTTDQFLITITILATARATATKLGETH
jgi:hypothetical protein